MQFANGPPVVLQTNNGTAPTNLDPTPEVTYFNGGGGYTAVQPYAELTSVNNFFTPFNVTKDKKMYLCLYLTFAYDLRGPNHSIWGLLVGAKGLPVKP